jgi:NADH-quinone oxidoreductase subunit D
VRKEKYVLPIGPYHPMLHEPEFFTVFLEGEQIIDLDLSLGYNHRGIEKIAASKSNIYQSFEVVTRTCGICGEAYENCFSNGVEKILGLEIPKRAKYLKTLMAELNRVQSHLLWLGSFAYEIGFETLFMHVWADREIVLDLLEKISGGRIHYSFVTIGGTRGNISEEKIKQIKNSLRKLEIRFKIRAEIFRTDSVINKRVEKVGILKREKAKELGVVGPTARGSGLKIDVRKDLSYNIYPEIDFQVVTEKKGDARARMLVRIGEIFESIRIINQVLDKMPNGEINLKRKFFKLKKVETVSLVEAPRGELMHYIKLSKKKLERIRIRPPTYANLFALKEMLKKQSLADIPPTLSSIDPCFSCTDRIVAINLDEGETKVLKMEDLWNA